MSNPKQLNQMMRQMQKMQDDMAQAQAALAAETIEASAGGGMVEAVVTGTGALQSISIAAEVVDPDDIEMLEDLVVAAVNEAMEKSKAMAASKMQSVASGLGLPPGLL